MHFPLDQRLSIITAIHNGLAMNRLYWKALCANTQTPFELVILDNHSTDGSELFFEQLAEATRGTRNEVIYVRNAKNQSYPTSQLQGMKHARYAVLCFLNNDIWMEPGWELPHLRALSENPLFVLSPCGQEAQPTQKASDHLKQRWKKAVFVSRLWAFCLRQSEESRLWRALEIMYGKLNQFQNPTQQSELGWFNGIKGDAVILHRALLEKLPQIWDERIEAADWHLYMLVAALNEKDPSVPLPRVLLNSYVHHFGRYSAKQKFEPLENAGTFLSIDSVWGKEAMSRLWWGNRLPQN